MAKNDTFLLDGIIDDRVSRKLPSDKRGEVFEFFAFEQIMKDSNFSREDLQSGWIDGKDDGGIDGTFILVNGHLLNDASSFTWPKSSTELEVIMITCKHHDTFKQAPLDNLAASLSEILDLSIENSDLKGEYSDELLKFRDLLKSAYRKSAARLHSFKFRFITLRAETHQVLENRLLLEEVKLSQLLSSLLANRKALLNL